MAYEINDDFEDLRGEGIDPEKARRANRMFRRWIKPLIRSFRMPWVAVILKNGIL
jgi:hypothetical protein